jgi:death on curing protein
MTIHRLTRKDLLAIHSMQIARYGGTPGVKSPKLLESALEHVPDTARANSSAAHSLVRIAAAYACGIAKCRPFVDGNRRTALVAALTFIERNGFRVTATQQDSYFALYNLGFDKPSEGELASWLEHKVVPAPK